MPINNWLGNIQDWFLPRLCPACGAGTDAGRDLCCDCENQLPRLHHACPVCAIPYDHPDIAGPCGVCQKRPPAFDETLALYHYTAPVDYFIRELKFHRRLEMAALLGTRLAGRLKENPQPVEMILPVPLHLGRLRERGYNQSLEIARPVARALGIPLEARGLTRVRATPPQAGLSLAARRRNVKNAFRVKNPQAIQGRCVALVDDVMTTGSTVQAAAQALRHAGASSIIVWVIARA